MAMCYANYDLSISHGITPLSATSQHPQQHSAQVLPQPQQQTNRISSVAAATALVTVSAAPAATALAAAASNNLNSQKDYSIPLHVDCSVEYELPNQPKPPAGQRVEPLLMIHPCYFRKMESQRRSPFINNMPSSSRNSTALLVGVSTSANNIATSATISSSRRSSTRQQQQSQVILQAQHLHQRQASSAQYNTIQHHNSQQQQLLRPPQNNSQQMSQMSQQAHYPVVSIPSSSISSVNGQYIEHASAIRRAAAAVVSSAHRSHQSRSSATTASQQQKLLHHQQHQSHNHQQNLLVQNSSTSAASHWDQLAAVATIVTSITPHNPSIIPPTNMPSRNVCTVKCCSTSNSVVGKRDAMISGGYAANGTPRTQPGRMSNNTNSSSKHNNEIPSNSHGISTSLVDTTNLRWNTATSLMIDRSPIATVPSNYQAGPDTTPTIIQNTQKINNDNNASIRNNVSSSGKYRQYLRSHRAHPYLATNTPSVSAGPSSIASVNHISQGFPQLSTTTTTAATAAVATTPTFQQHLQQISCYNV